MGVTTSTSSCRCAPPPERTATPGPPAVIHQIQLHNIRSWTHGTVALGSGPQLLWGVNGAGKTTLLEACIIAATGRSHRASVLREVVARGADAARLTVTVGDEEVADPLAQSTLAVEIPAHGRTQTLLNGTPRRPAALMERIKVAVFVPEETGLVVGAPAVRRALIDRVATQWHPGYEQALTRYERALKQRNRLLKDALEADGATRRALALEMRPWTEMLIATGAEIIEGRLALLMALDAPLAEAHREVAPSEGTIAMRYTSRENYDPSAPREKIATMLTQAFADTAETEGYQGHTLVGPHRDDATFLVGGNNLAATASRGQQRSLLLALLFAEIALLTDRAGRPPILLLDDAFSELDPSRRDRLVERLKHLPQTLITATSPDDLAPNLVAVATAIEIINTDEGSEAKR